VLAAVLGLAAMPASATELPPYEPPTYTFLGCTGATGAIIGLSPVPAAGTHNLAHAITPCETPSSTNVYGVVIYYPDGYLPVPYQYPPPGASPILTAELVVEADAEAVCLLSRPDIRVVCAGIVVDPSGDATLGPEIDVHAAVVSHPIKFQPAIMRDPQPPACPGCAW
jgi:hypothetical protein